MKRFSFLVLVCAGLGLLLRIGLHQVRSGSETTGRWVEVHKETSARTLREMGTLEPLELARIQSETGGVITEIGEDGSPVEKGDLILKLDEEETRGDLEAEQEELDQAREDFEAQQAEYAVLTNTFEVATRLKLRERDHAELALEAGSVPVQPEEKRRLEIDIALARIDLEEKRSELERQEDLVRRNFAPPSSLDRLRLEVASARTFLEETQSQYELATQPVAPEDRLTLEAALQKAVREVQRNRERQDRQIEIQELQMAGLKLDIRHKEERMEELRRKLKQVRISAPATGLLRLTRKYVWSARGWQPLSVGQDVNGGDIVATIVDPDQLSLRLMVHESDWPLIQEGQPVRASLTAFPGEELQGKVASKTGLGQDRGDLSPLYRQSRASDQAFFLVHVDLEMETAQAMPGMTVTAELEVSPPRPRLYIPRAALESETPPYQVLRRGDGNEQRVRVEGRFDRLGRFEVTSGLTPGDAVWVPRRGEDA